MDNIHLQVVKEILVELLITKSKALTKEYIKDCLKSIRDNNIDQIKSKIYEIEETLTGRQGDIK